MQQHHGIHSPGYRHAHAIPKRDEIVFFNRFLYQSFQHNNIILIGRCFFYKSEL